MNESVDGIVINLNAYGATVRLENGDLARASLDDVDAHRTDYERSLSSKRELCFEMRHEGRRPIVVLAPQIRDEELDEQIASYLKSTQEWDAPDGVPQAERHFLRKKRRAALFESRHQP